MLACEGVLVLRVCGESRGGQENCQSNGAALTWSQGMVCKQRASNYLAEAWRSFIGQGGGMRGTLFQTADWC